MRPLPVSTKEEGPYGFGTTPAVEALLKHLKESRDTTVLIAVNLATLVRNQSAASKKAQDIVQEVQNHMTNFANEVAGICQEKWKNRHHNILFYLTKPEKAIPPAFSKAKEVPKEPPKPGEVVPSPVVTAMAIDLLSKTLKNCEQTDRNVTVYVRLADKMLVPSYKGLTKALNELAPLGVDLKLISHCYLDYHVTTSSGREGLLFRSHTGEVVKMTPSALGKIVFKNDNVPFYPITHVLLGDKDLIKPALEKQEKSRFLKLAETERWNTHTNTFLSTKIKENKFTLPYNL